jgi:phage FluMu protein Com
MCKEKANGQTTTQAAVRCDQCMRIIAYRVVPGTGRIQIKCSKCGREMIVDLSDEKVKD